MAGYSTPAWANGTSPAVSAANLLALGQAVELSQHPYGVCSTAAATAAKTVTLDYSGTLSLFAGLCIRVKFANSNSASNPTLNVNSTGAIPIRAYGTISAATWLAGQVISFVYDGTNWLYDGIAAYTQGQTLSAATAQAIGAFAGAVPSTPDAALSALAANCAKIASGTYTGNGTYGVNNPNTLTFGFSPLAVAVFTDYSALMNFGLAPANGGNAWFNSFLWLKGQNRAEYFFIDTSQGYTQQYLARSSFQQNGNTLSWYMDYSNGGDGPTGQLNGNGKTYYYLAIGV